MVKDNLSLASNILSEHCNGEAITTAICCMNGKYRLNGINFQPTKKTIRGLDQKIFLATVNIFDAYREDKLWALYLAREVVRSCYMINFYS